MSRRIPAKGYPITSKKYPPAHALASKLELHKFGKTGYDHLNIISKKHPGELLGTHDAHGHIKVSSVVPTRLIPEVKFHEKMESILMKKREI